MGGNFGFEKKFDDNKDIFKDILLVLGHKKIFNGDIRLLETETPKLYTVFILIRDIGNGVL